jgi:LacI family transcriptional regulator
MADVARHAAVSPATVSRVLSGGANVKAAHKRRVLDAVEELGYTPNRIAQNLRRQRTTAIGVVVPDIENPHFSEMVRAVEDRAYRQGYPVLVCNTDESPEKQRSYLKALLADRVIGVVLAASDPTGDEITELLDREIPIVAYDREIADPRADAVIADNVQAARSAVELLVRAGHSRIAYVSGRKNVETGAERLDGYELTMRSHQLTPHVIDGNFRTEDAERAVSELLDSAGRPTALVVGNNLMTLGALAAAQAAGITIPADLALVAFDDPRWASLVQPPLTTLAQPVRKMATEATELLLERISGARTESRRTVHPFVLHRRVSCGTAGAAP